MESKIAMTINKRPARFFRRPNWVAAISLATAGARLRVPLLQDLPHTSIVDSIASRTCDHG